MKRIILAMMVGAGLWANGFQGQPKDFALKGDIKKGEELYKTNCALCHGVKGDGKGFGGEGLNPPPGDFTKSTKLKTRSDWQKFLVVRDGGKKYGLSASMASYKTSLTEQNMKEIILFIKTFAK